MTSFDFSPLFRSAIGFDRLTDALENARRLDTNGYPPYNIELTGEDQYRITMAVAGFSPDELEIEVKESKLRVSGSKNEDTEQHRYLYRGIANRSFERTYQLADHVRVEGAEVKDGLLHVELVREIPEAMKPRRIEIRGARKAIESQAADAA
jgi:molecular chaperone IbpA